MCIRQDLIPFCYCGLTFTCVDIHMAVKTKLVFVFKTGYDVLGFCIAVVHNWSRRSATSCVLCFSVAYHTFMQKSLCTVCKTKSRSVRFQFQLERSATARIVQTDNYPCCKMQQIQLTQPDPLVYTSQNATIPSSHQHLYFNSHFLSEPGSPLVFFWIWHNLFKLYDQIHLTRDKNSCGVGHVQQMSTCTEMSAYMMQLVVV